MTSKCRYTILTWSRNTERRCAAGEPPIRLHWPIRTGAMVRIATHFSGLARRAAAEQDP
jgi:hypothetical protein